MCIQLRERVDLDAGGSEQIGARAIVIATGSVNTAGGFLSTAEQSIGVAK